MKLSTSCIAATLIFVATAAPSKACCQPGCWTVKGNSFVDVECFGVKLESSVADYGARGKCADIRRATSLQAFNNGCVFSTPLFIFYDDPECKHELPGSRQREARTGNGECFDKPVGAAGMIVVGS